jgi:DnaJ homolog subfamily C member 28
MPNIEEQIRRAIEEGSFDNLPGQGRPLNLEEDPFEDPDWRLANHILCNAGFSLPWIESRREIEADLEAARTALAQAWADYRAGMPNPGMFLRRWEQAQDIFRQAVAEINRRIAGYNLEVPSLQLQRILLDPVKEIERIIGEAPK